MHGRDTSSVPCRDATWRAKWKLGFNEQVQSSLRRYTCQTPFKTQTDRHQESNLVHFSLKKWHLVAIIFNDFPDKQLTKCRVFIGWFRIFITPLLPVLTISMRHRASSTHRMDAPDRHNRQTNKQTDGRVCVNVSLIRFDSTATIVFVAGAYWPVNAVSARTCCSIDLTVVDYRGLWRHIARPSQARDFKLTHLP